MISSKGTCHHYTKLVLSPKIRRQFCSTFSIQCSFTTNTGTELSTLLVGLWLPLEMLRISSLLSYRATPLKKSKLCTGPHQQGLLLDQELYWIKSTISKSSLILLTAMLSLGKAFCIIDYLVKFIHWWNCFLSKREKGGIERISKDTFPTQAFKTFCEIELRHIILAFFQRRWKEVSHQSLYKASNNYCI